MSLFQRAGRGCMTILWCTMLGIGLANAREPAPPDVPRVIDETNVPGAWRLVHSEMRMRDGTTFPNPQYGSNPHGYIMYDKSHTMCVFLAATDEPSRAPPGFVREGPGPQAKRPATYCGRWRLNDDRTAIIHQIEVALDQSMIGDQVRKAWIDGDTLTIRSPLPKNLTDYYLQFERMK